MAMPGQATPDSDAGQIVEGLFRRNYGQLVATLTRVFGSQHLDLVEDVVQETLLKALQQWSYRGLPDNPAGWLYRVARNAALDALRRERTLVMKVDALAGELGEAFPGPETHLDNAAQDDRLRDDQLRLIFGCCHPALPRAAQIALTLKTLAEVERLLADTTLTRYPLAHATRADFLRRLGRPNAAHEAYARALSLTVNATERRFIERQMAELPVGMDAT